MKILSRLLVAVALLGVAFPSQASVIPSIPYNLTNGSLADATQVMGNFNTIVTDVNANAATSGANSNITSITGLTTTLAHSLGGTIVYTGGTTGGTANVQTLSTVSPTSFTLAAGKIVTAVAGFSNSGATTLNVAGLGNTNVRVGGTAGPTALVGGEIVAGNAYAWMYDGTYLILLNPSGYAPLASPAFTGVPTAPTAAANTNTTQIATTAFVTGSAFAPLASPALTGTPTAPTAASNTSTTQLATTAFANPASSLSTTGSVTMPSGLIEKWGTVTATAGASTAVTFGTAFPNAIYNVQVTPQFTGPGTLSAVSVAASPAPSTTGFTYFNSNGVATITSYWTALGK